MGQMSERRRGSNPTEGPMKVRFCENNKGKGKALRRLEEEHPEVDARVEKCLGICGACAEQPVALVGGRKVTGKDGDDLYRRIVTALAEGDKEDAAEVVRKR